METTPETAPEQEDLTSPPDFARAAESAGVTAVEQREGEPLEERLAQEQPDAEPVRRQEAGRLVDDDAVIDDEKDLVAAAAEDDLDGRSAEEAAVRIEDEPAGLTGGSDSYLENDPAS